MMYCPHCGKAMHETAVACPQCGAVTAIPATSIHTRTDRAQPIWLAITSMVIGILDILIGIGTPRSEWDADTNNGFVMFACIALIFGIVSVASNYRGKGIAIAGIVLASIALLMALGMSSP